MDDVLAARLQERVAYRAWRHELLAEAGATIAEAERRRSKQHRAAAAAAVAAATTATTATASTAATATATATASAGARATALTGVPEALLDALAPRPSQEPVPATDPRSRDPARETAPAAPRSSYADPVLTARLAASTQTSLPPATGAALSRPMSAPSSLPAPAPPATPMSPPSAPAPSSPSVVVSRLPTTPAPAPTDDDAAAPAPRSTVPAPLALVDHVTVSNPTRVDAIFGSYILYTCIVHRRFGDNLVVQKRYSDFEKLRENLMRAHSTGPSPQTAGLPELPEKRLMGKFKAKVIEERRRGLEDLLMYVLKNQVLAASPVTVAWFKTSE